MKRKIFILSLTMFTIVGTWAYDFKSGDLCYNIISENEVEVTVGGMFNEVISEQ